MGSGGLSPLLGNLPKRRKGDLKTDEDHPSNKKQSFLHTRFFSKRFQFGKIRRILTGNLEVIHDGSFRE